MRQGTKLVGDYLTVMQLSVDQLAERCEISPTAVRMVLKGDVVGAKVALALAKLIPALTVEMLIDPEHDGGDEGAAPKRPPFRAAQGSSAR